MKQSASGIEERLKHLRDELYKLHEAMLEAEESALDANLTTPASAKDSVEAEYHDPASGWVKELHALVTQFDASLGSSISREDAIDLIEQTKALMIPEVAGLPGERRPMEILGQDSAVAAAHNNILALLEELEPLRQ